MPFSVREGINIFLAGFIPTENLRFRTTELTFKVSEQAQEEIKRTRMYEYPDMTKDLGGFSLAIEVRNCLMASALINFVERRI